MSFNDLPICAECGTAFKCKENSVVVIKEYASDKAAHSADLWECSECDAKIVLGIADTPFAMNWQDDYNDKVKAFGRNVIKVTGG